MHAPEPGAARFPNFEFSALGLLAMPRAAKDETATRRHRQQDASRKNRGAARRRAETPRISRQNPKTANYAARHPKRRQRAAKAAKQGNGKAAPSTADHGGTHPKGNRGRGGKPMPPTAGSRASRPDRPDTMPRATPTGTPHGSPTRLQRNGSGLNSRWQWRSKAREIAADGLSHPEMINYTTRHPKRQQTANMTATGAHTDTAGGGTAA